MVESFSNLILSDLFTFHVGTGEKKDAIQVHSRAIAATCDYMKNLIEGDMKEAHERSAEQDMEMEDFVRFVEYAYRGDYTAPSCILEVSSAQNVANVGDDDDRLAHEEGPIPSTTEIEEPVTEEVVDGVHENTVEDEVWGSWKKDKKDKKEKKKNNTTEKTSAYRAIIFDKREYCLNGDPKAVILKGFDPFSNTTSEQDFKPVFLAYARLYSFAEMRLIHDLKSLTLHKLQQTLKSFTLYPERIGDVVELARYTYELTPNRKPDGTVDELRKLVVSYISCECLRLGKKRVFKELLEEGGEFVSDFWDVLRKHIM